MKKDVQPAKVSYFFGPGYSDVKKAIRFLWQKNAEDAKKYYSAYNEVGLMSFKGLFNFSRALSIMTFGSLFSIILSLLIVLILMVCVVPVYFLFTLVWIIDRVYLLSHRISVSCSFCMSNYLLPVYECECGKRHSDLTPGKYGIWHRTCICGRKLPTNCFNGRKHIKAICPKCLSEGRITYLNEKETRPICIPVVGGRSVGKTAFITAFSKIFIDNVASLNNMTISFYDDKTELMYKNFETTYAQGSTAMTQKIDSRTNNSAIDFCFFVHHEKLKPDRLFHIYDIAGETFTKNEEYELPKHFTYSQGMIFIIDPFSLPDVRASYEHLLNPEDIAGIGCADISLILDSFLAKLRIVTGMKDSEMSNIPIAILLSKTDSPGIESFFSENVVSSIINQPDNRKLTRNEAYDILCRKFLVRNGASGFVNSLDMKFRNTRFFCVSAIGHSRNKGSYSPKGVLEPIKWICSLSDRSFFDLWIK